MINAPPQYDKADQRYRQARTPQEQYEALQEMLRLIPKHKSSEKAQADLKRRLSAVRKQIAHAAKAPVGHVDPYMIPRSGAAQVLLLGLANTGKSSLVAAVSNAPVKVTDFPYGTTAPVPGVWAWHDVKFQMIDTPPIGGETIDGNLLNAIRRADLALLVIDAASPENLDQITVVQQLLAQRRVTVVGTPESDAGEEVDFALPTLILATHADAVAPEDLDVLAELYGGALPICAVDCIGGAGLDELGQRMWEMLGLIRVYSKVPGVKSELADPFTLPIGSTVDDFARAVHRELPEKLRFARVWGGQGHDGRQVHGTEELTDGDIVELHTS